MKMEHYQNLEAARHRANYMLEAVEAELNLLATHYRTRMPHQDDEDDCLDMLSSKLCRVQAAILEAHLILLEGN